MSSTQKKLMLIDLICVAISAFIFLFVSPSIEGRPRLIYIAPQIALCAGLLFGSRFLFGIYKEYFMDAGGRNLGIMFMQLILADTVAAVVYYLLQKLLPDGMKITLLRLVCVFAFSLLEAIVCRLCMQTGFTLNADNRRLLEAVAKSGKTTDEIIALIEK